MAGLWSFEVDQGTTFKASMTYTAAGIPVDLTGSAFTLEIKPVSGHPKITYNLTNYIFLESPESGKFRIEIPDTETLEFRWRKANYHLTFEDSLSVSKILLRGTITVNRKL